MIKTSINVLTMVEMKKNDNENEQNRKSFAISLTRSNEIAISLTRSNEILLVHLRKLTKINILGMQPRSLFDNDIDFGTFLWLLLIANLNGLGILSRDKILNSELCD